MDFKRLLWGLSTPGFQQAVWWVCSISCWGFILLGSSKPYSSRTWFAIWRWAMAHLLSGLFLAPNILSPALLSFFAFPSAKLPHPAPRTGQRGSLRWILLPSYYTGPRVSLDSKSILGCEWHEERKESEVAQSCPTLCDPVDCSHQAPPSMRFSRQEYWSGFPKTLLRKWKGKPQTEIFFQNIYLKRDFI